MKVSIRPLTEKDAYTSVKWRNIPEIWKYTKFKADNEITIQNELSWIRKVMNDSNSYRFAIIADNTYVGNTYLTDVNKETAEFHIFIGDKKYWGKGIAKEVTSLVLAFAKSELHLQYITLEVIKENLAAMRTYINFGFEEYGKNGDFIKMRLGPLSDIIIE